MAEKIGIAITHMRTRRAAQLTGVMAKHQGDIASVDILESRRRNPALYFEIELPSEPATLVADLQSLRLSGR